MVAAPHVDTGGVITYNVRGMVGPMGSCMQPGWLGCIPGAAAVAPPSAKCCIFGSDMFPHPLPTAG